MTYRHRILIIDDDPLFRSLIVSVLRRDFVVAVAADGEEGYFKALEHVPDLAVVDVQMPGWDGLRTLKTFRAQPSLASLPVVMLTSDASKDTVLAAIQAGANDYVIKVSFSKEEFLAKLNRILNPQKTTIAAQPVVVAKCSSREAPVQPQRQSGLAEATSPNRPVNSVESQGESAEKLAEILDGWE